MNKSPTNKPQPIENMKLVLIEIPLVGGSSRKIATTKQEARKWLKANGFTQTKTIGKSVCNGLWVPDTQRNSLMEFGPGGTLFTQIDTSSRVDVTELHHLSNYHTCNGAGD